MVDNRFYVIPNFETVVLGGTAQQGDWNADVSEQVRLGASRRRPGSSDNRLRLLHGPDLYLDRHLHPVSAIF